MAGFIQRGQSEKNNKFFGNFIKKLGSFGLEFNDEVIKNSFAISPIEAEMRGNVQDKEMLYAFKSTDMGDKKYIAYFDQEYGSKRDTLLNFAINGEVESILDTVADEAIIYDNQNFFCTPDLSLITPYLDPKNKKVNNILENINTNFKRIYNMLYLTDSVQGWQLFKQFLIEGFLVLEIVYDKEQTKIIGFQILDPVSIRPDVKMIDGKYRKIWRQYEEDNQMSRELLDSQIIYISYNKANQVQRVSYMEKFMRSFNLMRIMENTRIIWNIMHATYRLKMIMPIGSQSRKDAKQDLEEIKNDYKEEITLDAYSGELSVGGKANIPFYQNYLIPSKDGEQPEIETISGEGPELRDVDIIEYFRNKMRIESGIPMNRFESHDTNYDYENASSVTTEELQFSKMINRLRSIFQELILKPLYIQMILDFPDLKDDFLFKENLGLKFNSNNIFEDLKNMDIMSKKVDFVSNMQQFMLDANTPFFSGKFLMEKYIGLSKDDLELNQRYKEEELELLKKAEEAAMAAQQQMQGGGDDEGGSSW